jgi:hypothetical protein
LLHKARHADLIVHLLCLAFVRIGSLLSKVLALTVVSADLAISSTTRRGFMA